MRLRVLITEIVFIPIKNTVAEVMMNRTAFELIQKDTSRNSQIDDVGESRK